MTPRPQVLSVIGNGLDPARTKHMQGRGDCAGGGDDGGEGTGSVPAAAEWARGWWQPQVRAMPLQEIMLDSRAWRKMTFRFRRRSISFGVAYVATVNQNLKFHSETKFMDFQVQNLPPKDGMEQSNREVMVHCFLPARSPYLRFTCVDRSVNENNPTNYIIFFVSYSNLCGI